MHVCAIPTSIAHIPTGIGVRVTLISLVYHGGQTEGTSCCGCQIEAK